MDKQLQISSSLEDYLETIAELTDNGGHAHAKVRAQRIKIVFQTLVHSDTKSRLCHVMHLLRYYYMQTGCICQPKRTIIQLGIRNEG